MKFSQSNRSKLLASEFTIIVTGATGWLGRAALEMLAETYGPYFSHRVRAFANSRKTIRLRGGVEVACFALSEIADLAPGTYIFFHFAFLGKERVPELSHADYARRVQEIGELTADAMRRVDTCGIILPSSGAVYNSDRSLNDDLERNPYGALKLRDEKYFTQLAEEFEIPVTICRIFNLSGPYINKLETYALSSILLDLLHNRPIQIQAVRPVIRSYVHVRDALDLMLLCQFARTQGHLVFDTVGEMEIEIGDLARMAAGFLGRPDHAIIRPPLEPGPPNRYVGDPEHLRTLLEKFGHALIGFVRQVEDTAAFLKDSLPAS